MRLLSIPWTCLAVFGPSIASAQAARATLFSIPPKIASEALIDFAVQANLSIGGVETCRGSSPGLSGRYSIDEGLRRLLAQAGCGFRRVAPDTIQIFAAPRSQPRQARAAEPVEPPQPPPIPPTPDDPNIVVTATKRSAAIGALPYAVSAVSHAQLEQAGAQDVNDITSQVPGLATTNLGMGRDKILLRGLSDGVFTGRTQSTVDIYLDDVPITYNAPDPDLQLADVEDIEVLRGPQGALYGAGSMSGVYRIVTRKPSLDTWSGYARAGGSMTNAGAPSEEFEGMLNVPLVPGQVGARFVAYSTHEGGYIDDTALRLSNVDQTLRTGARGVVRAAFGPGWLATLSTEYQSIDSADAQYVTAGGGRLHRANQILESSRNNFSATALSIQHWASWGQLQSTSSFVQHKFSSQADASDALPLFGLSAPAVGSYRQPIDVQMATEDIVLSSPGAGRLQWVAGLFGSASWETTDSVVRADANSATPAATLYSEHRTDQRDRAALYADVSYALTSRLTATAGIRTSTTSGGTQSVVEAPLENASRLYSGHVSGAGYTPKLALTYALTENQHLYAVVSEGRRDGGVNTGGPIGTVFVTTPNTAGVHLRFGSDRLWNYEAGGKFSLLDGRLVINADVFYDVWDNIQTDQYMPSGLSYTANAGDGRSYGAELEAAARLFRGFTLQTAALVDSPELTRANPGFVSGVNLPGVPDLQVSGRASYQWTLIGNVGALVFAEAEYVGHSKVTFSPISFSQGGYILARLSAQVQKDSWRMALFLSNPANSRANTFAYGNPFNFQQSEEVTPERPLTLRAVLSKEF